MLRGFHLCPGPPAFGGNGDGPGNIVLWEEQRPCDGKRRGEPVLVLTAKEEAQAFAREKDHMVMGVALGKAWKWLTALEPDAEALAGKEALKEEILDAMSGKTVRKAVVFTSEEVAKVREALEYGGDCVQTAGTASFLSHADFKEEKDAIDAALALFGEEEG